jgi:hypothetical protein
MSSPPAWPSWPEPKNLHIWALTVGKVARAHIIKLVYLRGQGEVR